MKNNGQIIIGAIALMVLLAILVPTLVRYIQQDSTSTNKQTLSTQAFQLAESAVEHGFQQLILSSTTWSNVQSGAIPPGYNFDQVYDAGNNGQYEIRFAAGPASNQLTVTGVGKYKSSSEIRAVKAIYSIAGVGNNSITAGNTITIGASVNVEWGSVTSYTSIVTGGRLHPRFYSSGNIDLDTNGSTPPNTDNKQWWSYDTNLPAQPQVDLPYYKAQAQSYGANLNAGCPAYYTNAGAGVNTFITGCIDNSGRTYYFETGDWTWKNPGTNYITGNIILASGNMSISGNGGAGGTESASVPPLAWQEYHNAWSAYQAFDATYGSFDAASAANYTASGVHYTINNVLVHGFVYAGGGTGLVGGGNARFHGVVMTPNTVTINTSNYTIYFDSGVAANIHTLNSTPTRASWQEISTCSWSGTHPTCP